MSKPRILVTRSPHQASELAEALRLIGLEPILLPTIELAAPTSYGPLEEALLHLDRFHWLLFTSANAVEAFERRREALRLPSGQKGSVPGPATERSAKHGIAAIGPATARTLSAAGLAPTLIPEQAVAESLTAALMPHAQQPDGTATRFLLVRAETARDHLPEVLRAAGGDVTIAAAYRTIIPASSVVAIQALFADPAKHPAAITFTSSSTAENLFALLKTAGLTLPAGILRASIGPITSQTLETMGYPAHVQARQATVAALVEAVKESAALKFQVQP